MTTLRKILVVGSGAREHALAERLLASPSVEEVIVTPGNAGTGNPARASAVGKRMRNAQGDVLDICREENVDLVVVGPEPPLCDGLVDSLTLAGVRAFGPVRAAARLEASKVFMKQFAERHGIPTARYRVVTDVAEVAPSLVDFPSPPVVKADGLCAGKGVVVTRTHREAELVAAEMLSGERFGEAGRSIVLEERIPGTEASIHAISDGKRFILLPAVQDHKRLRDGDEGPNTGGMGTFGPSSVITPELEARIQREIFERAFAGMADEGTPFRGALFAGLMIKRDGSPVLLEFNVRFGDPETQVLLAITDGDLAQALAGAAAGELDPDALRRSLRAAVCVVLAAQGYPDRPRSGDVISGIEAAESLAGVRVFHAGTALQSDKLVTHGGRVLGVTAQAADLGGARALAYQAAGHIQFSGLQLRSDIGA